MFRKKLSSFLFYFSMVAFIIAFNFEHNPPGGWYQQFLPDLNNRPLVDMQFLDSLTGYGITGDNTVGDTNFILKTTNGGDNWFIVHTIYRDLSSLKFINQSTGFVCGGFNAVGGIVIKTTDGGKNWFSLNASFANHFDDMFVLNEDTIWIVDDNGFNGGVFKTTDGGMNWVTQFSSTGNNPAGVYMINSQVGFISGGNGSYLKKTTNGGSNWFEIENQIGFRDIFFIDTLTGWKSYGSMKKTTDGGLTWISQELPVTSGKGILTFSNVNKDTIWGVGGYIFHPGFLERGIIYKTTNGGEDWGYQVPDSISINILQYNFCNFVNKSNGWAHSYFKGVHTVSGGDSITIYTGIQNINSNIPDVFELYQNYPNPFNPKTIIFYRLKFSSIVKLKVYDILGNEIKTLVNKKQIPGEYKIQFNGSDLPSGTYFYRLETEDDKGNGFNETKKMILIR